MEEVTPQSQCSEECSIGHEEEQMLMDSVRRLGSGLRYYVEYSDTKAVAQDRIASDVVTTVKDLASRATTLSTRTSARCRRDL